MARSAVSRPIIDTMLKNPTTKDAQEGETARMGPNALVRLPPASRTSALSAGSAMSSQAYAVIPVAAAAAPSAVASVSTGWLLLQLQEVGVVDGGRTTGAEDGHDDGQSDDHLGGRDDHDEQRDHLAVQAAVDAGEGDEGEVGRVEHQLDAHEHDDRVATQQDRGRADGEEDRREVDVVDEVHRCEPPSISPSIACSAAW